MNVFYFDSPHSPCITGGIFIVAALWMAIKFQICFKIGNRPFLGSGRPRRARVSRGPRGRPDLQNDRFPTLNNFKIPQSTATYGGLSTGHVQPRMAPYRRATRASSVGASAELPKLRPPLAEANVAGRLAQRRGPVVSCGDACHRSAPFFHFLIFVGAAGNR